MLVKTTATGSKGNNYALISGEEILLLECGVPAKEMLKTIAKDRDGGLQDYFIPLYYEVESKRLKNSFTENKIYGWGDNADGFTGTDQMQIPFE